jgi:hypothetical protein
LLTRGGMMDASAMADLQKCGMTDKRDP